MGTSSARVEIDFSGSASASATPGESMLHGVYGRQAHGRRAHGRRVHGRRVHGRRTRRGCQPEDSPSGKALSPSTGARHAGGGSDSTARFSEGIEPSRYPPLRVPPMVWCLDWLGWFDNQVEEQVASCPTASPPSPSRVESPSKQHSIRANRPRVRTHPRSATW